MRSSREANQKRRRRQPLEERLRQGGEAHEVVTGRPHHHPGASRRETDERRGRAGAHRGRQPDDRREGRVRSRGLDDCNTTEGVPDEPRRTAADASCQACERAGIIVQLASDERQIAGKSTGVGSDLPGIAIRPRDAGEVRRRDDEAMAREVRSQVVVVQTRAAEAVGDQNQPVASRERLDVPPRAPRGVPDLDPQRPVAAALVDQVRGRDADRELAGPCRIGRGRRAAPERQHEEGGRDPTTHALIRGQPTLASSDRST